MGSTLSLDPLPPLPIELLCEIFLLLPTLGDRRNAMLTCKQWYRGLVYMHATHTTARRLHHLTYPTRVTDTHPPQFIIGEGHGPVALLWNWRMLTKSTYMSCLCDGQFMLPWVWMVPELYTTSIIISVHLPSQSTLVCLRFTSSPMTIRVLSPNLVTLMRSVTGQPSKHARVAPFTAAFQIQVNSQDSELAFYCVLKWHDASTLLRAILEAVLKAPELGWWYRRVYASDFALLERFRRVPRGLLNDVKAWEQRLVDSCSFSSSPVVTQ